MTSTQDWKTRFETFLNGRGKIQQLAELTAVEAMRATAEETRKNQEAESKAVRKQLWGSDETESEDDMATTILGDVTYAASPASVSQTTPQSSTAPLLAGMALGASLLGLPAAGLAGYMLAQSDNTPEPTVESVEFDDESVSIGLGRIEDYLKDQP